MGVLGAIDGKDNDEGEDNNDGKDNRYTTINQKRQRKE